MSHSACYRKAEDVVTRNVAGETVLVPIGNSVADLESIFTLDEVGTFLWERLDGATPAAELSRALCREYAVDASAAERDTQEFLETLQEAGLVRAA